MAVTGFQAAAGHDSQAFSRGEAFAGMKAPELDIEAIQRLQFGKAAPHHHTSLLQHYVLISLAD